MASPGNQHFASCIGTVSFSIGNSCIALMRPIATDVARSVVSVLVYLYVAKTAEPIVGRFGEQMIRTILCIFNRDRWSNRRTVDCWEKVKTRCRAEPNVSPPGCATGHWRDENLFCG